MTSGGWHIAQFNIARFMTAADDPQVAEFFAELDRINAIADETPGFVWRLQDEDGNATALQPAPDDRLLVNMSVWEDAEALFDFVYRSAHTPVMAKRRQWFETFEGAYQALWWIDAGRIPTIDEGFSRLWMLDRYGPTPHAFTFKSRFPAPGAIGGPVDMGPDPWCVGTA